MKALVVLNPSSCDFEAERRFPELEPILRSLAEIELVETVADPAESQRRVWKALERGPERVIAIGGDGTVHFVINALLGPSPPSLPELAVIPFGTANNVAKSLELPLRDLAEVAKIAVGGTLAGLDVGKITAALSGATRYRYFVDSVTVGMDADVLAARGRYRDLKGYLAYVAAIAERAIEQHSLDIHVEVDGVVLDTRVFNVIVNNVPVYAGELVMPDSAADDGKLDLYLFNRREYSSKLMTFAIKQMDLLNLGVSDLLEDLTENQRTLHGKNVKLRLASPRNVQVDGEVFGEADEVVSEIVAQLRVAAP